jgi:starch-binding outer membrane protein, SusD/RagB family
VNMIRRRAKNLNIHSPSPFDLKPGLSPEAFADSVVWERAWELAGEPEGRWFDLVRLEKVEELSKLNNPRDGDFPLSNVITKSDYYFPIPESEIILNPILGE